MKIMKEQRAETSTKNHTNCHRLVSKPNDVLKLINTSSTKKFDKRCSFSSRHSEGKQDLSQDFL